ncbi:hypothetical protein ASD50_20735 [Mesorhizobium sp. Root552]|uniref:hypothetical protein n=1 Tax=Mesorhizobium sp. Root552 TaxID=1736555 RepID=UPI0006F246DB|nr:hypothetical protein [Mesorhizobium sp. Root552]KQZ25852.1 hypothetical protein ASD50_20735 [Mesorhizobium sp. Root552]
MRSFIFGEGQEAKTPAQLARMRELADAMVAANRRAPQNVGEGLQSIGNAILYRSLMGKIGAGEKAGQNHASAAMNNIAGALAGQKAFPNAPGASTSSTAVPRVTKRDDPNLPSRLDFARSDASSLPSSFLAATDRTEGGGDYDTLFGHSQREGKAFAGTRVSGMSIKDALAFADPNGPYAQSVKGQIGRVATPMGRHQIVGKTLRNAVDEMGLDLNMPFNKDTQDAIASHLAKNRLAGQSTMEGKVAALRSEWEGFKNVPYSEMVQIVNDFQNGGSASPAVAAIERQAPVQVASLDPSAGVAEAMRPMPEEYAKSGMTPETWAKMNAPNGSVPTPAAPAPQAPVSAPVAPPQGGNQQIAQAMLQQQSQPQGQDLSQIPAMAGGTGGAIQYGPQGGPSLQMLMETANDPFLNDSQRGIVDALMQQQMQNADPLRQMQIKKLQREIDAPTKDWQKLDDNTLYSPSTGETKVVNKPASTGQFRFEGKSVEAQALNGLMDSGKLTPDQAQQLAAGKTISNPADGSIMFMTPDGIFQQPGPAPAAPQDAPAPPPAPSAPPQGTQPARPGMIPITGPKPEKPMNKEQTDAATFADRMTDALKDMDAVPEAGASVWGQAITDNDYVPDVAEGFLTSEPFKKFAQARRNFINAVLRRESGAIISPSEFADANKQYFPMPGDTPEVLDQKRKNRQTVLDGMIRAAGPAYQGATTENDPLGIR